MKWLSKELYHQQQVKCTVSFKWFLSSHHDGDDPSRTERHQATTTIMIMHPILNWTTISHKAMTLSMSISSNNPTYND
jgi:hypothetical protein